MGAKGKPKTGGRKPGTPNKATLLKPYKAALGATANVTRPSKIRTKTAES